MSRSLALLYAALVAPLALRAVDLYEGPARFARARGVEGRVAIGHAYEDDFVDLHDNEPVGEGDKLSVPAGGRVLLAFPDGSRVALAGPARLEMIHAGSRRPYEVRLHEGELFVAAVESRSIYVDSAEGGATVAEESQAAFSLDRDGLRVGVLRGEVEAGDEGASETVGAGQSAIVLDGEAGDLGRIGLGMGDPLRAWAAGVDRRDEVADERDARGDDDELRDDSDRRRGRDDLDDRDDLRDWHDARHDLAPEVSPYFDELSRHGRWRWIPGYGWAWRPYRVARGWVPFTAGFWRWTPWGMFWVSYEPWGWAPYRYGAWRFDSRFGWFWVPGPRFGGAWVMFYEEGDTWGWCPAYYDYGEWWPSHSTYIQINIVNIYNYNPRPTVITRPWGRRPMLGRPVMPAPPVGGGFTRHLPRISPPGGEPGSGPGPRIGLPPVRPAREVWGGRPVIGRRPPDTEPAPESGPRPSPRPRPRPRTGPAADGGPSDSTPGPAPRPAPRPRRGGAGDASASDTDTTPAPAPGPRPRREPPRRDAPPADDDSGGTAPSTPPQHPRAGRPASAPSPAPAPAPQPPPRPQRGKPASSAADSAPA